MNSESNQTNQQFFYDVNAIENIKKSEGDENENENESDDDEKKRNKRRSKNDTDGRNHKCQMCGKSYLSYPALYTHIKTKHKNNGPASVRGRGRPKKDNGELNSLKILYNPCSMEFFKNPERIGETKVEEIQECILRVFHDLYVNPERPDHHIIKSYLDSEAHPFFQEIKNYFYNQNQIDLDTDSATCDEVFSDYLHKVSQTCNKIYFSKVIKFVTLFRENLNQMYKEKTINTDRDFSQINNPEDAPDISNEFINEFLEADPKIYGYNRDEAIDLTQNLCQWLYDNNFTCSKLSLINNS